MNKISTLAQAPDFAKKIIDWQKRFGRHHLPWQGDNSYHTLISEVMLQQTQVKTVIDYFNRFITRFPNIQALGNASIDDILQHWQGLGYYRRAHHLHQCAQKILQNHDGTIPSDRQALQALPGLGRSTAAAISSLAFGKQEPILDGNVKRIFARMLAMDTPINTPAGEKNLWRLAENLMPAQNCRAYNQGLMDIGTQICTKTKPFCENCPVASACLAYLDHNTQAFPVSKPILKKPMTLFCTALIGNSNKNTYLLLDQCQGSIWKSLWFLPTYDSEATLLQATQSLQALEPKKPLIFKHQLTHRDMTLYVYLFQAPKSMLETKPYYFHQANTLAVPAIFHKILKGLT